MLQNTVDTSRDSNKRKAAELSVERKGLHGVKRCRLPSRCPRSLLTPPGRIFGGLAACDVLHAIFINYKRPETTCNNMVLG